MMISVNVIANMCEWPVSGHNEIKSPKRKKNQIPPSAATTQAKPYKLLCAALTTVWSVWLTYHTIWTAFYTEFHATSLNPTEFTCMTNTATPLMLRALWTRAAQKVNVWIDGWPNTIYLPYMLSAMCEKGSETNERVSVCVCDEHHIKWYTSRGHGSYPKSLCSSSSSQSYFMLLTPSTHWTTL